MPCPACGATVTRVFHEQTGVPVNSCLLLPRSEDAVNFPRGDIRLGLCERCGFITNTAFDPALIEYSDRYEETQEFSPRFRTFADDLAARWVERYSLTGKHVLEIGCGKGSFLVELCRHGVGRGTGIDPSVAPGRFQDPAAQQITWVAELYSDAYGPIDADAVVCRHTLEHIPDVGAFMRAVRRGIGDRSDTAVLFEVPDTLRVLREGAFWDVYYEHCSYFTPGSLSRLFRSTGFEVIDLWRGFEDQYLIVEARPVGASVRRGGAHETEEDLDLLERSVAAFQDGFRRQVEQWRDQLRARHRSGQRTVIWGAGSKAVAYLTALDVDGAIDVAVDINPHKHGMFLAGSGRRIASPEELRALRPEFVVAMNPVYLGEIREQLDLLGLTDTRLVGV